MDLSCERQAMLVLHLTHLLCIQLQVNQIGTVTESVQAALDSKAAGWGVMVSHRSGETEDNFIADLSVGLASGQVCFFFQSLDYSTLPSLMPLRHFYEVDHCMFCHVDKNRSSLPK
jgi:hypothetical protein